MKFHKAVASFLGVGYIGKGSGSIAAGIATGLIYMLLANIPESIKYFPILCGVVIITGVWSSSKLVQVWGKDPQQIVIDEVAGILVTLMFIPVTLPAFLVGFFLFRIFDILKPLGIKKAEKWPRGWGIMADDVLAGIYANLGLQLLIAYKLL